MTIPAGIHFEVMSYQELAELSRAIFREIKRRYPEQIEAALVKYKSVALPTTLEWLEAADEKSK